MAEISHYAIGPFRYQFHLEYLVNGLILVKSTKVIVKYPDNMMLIAEVRDRPGSRHVPGPGQNRENLSKLNRDFLLNSSKFGQNFN